MAVKPEDNSLLGSEHSYQVSSQPTSPFSSLIPHQQIAIVPSFTLESGHTLHNVPVAYTTKGRLNAQKNNALVLCHALSGSADAVDWWGPLVGGKGKAFDTTKFFLICLNSLGSPYGTASPVTAIDGDEEKGRYGPDFPLSSVRDDVRLHRLILEDLGVKQVAAVVGGSMGGMLVLEWAFLGREFVRSIVPIATSARHSAWCIGVGEVQRQSIYCDPKYKDGYYELDDQPVAGLGTARQHAMMMYRSAASFKTRFDRKPPDPTKRAKLGKENGIHTRQASDSHFAIHNDGHAISGAQRPQSNGVSRPHTPTTNTPNGQSLTSDGSALGAHADAAANGNSPSTNGTTTILNGAAPPTPPTPITPSSSTNGPTIQIGPTRYSVQDYLTYQRQKFTARFDSNCYIAITRKLDTHDISVHAPPSSHSASGADDPSPQDSVRAALQTLTQPALVLGIESDGLFKLAEQEEIAEGIRDSRLKLIESPEGHDAFLLEFEQVNGFVKGFFGEVLGDIVGEEGEDRERTTGEVEAEGEGEAVGFQGGRSTFGESEGEIGDITAW